MMKYINVYIYCFLYKDILLLFYCRVNSVLFMNIKFGCCDF